MSLKKYKVHSIELSTWHTPQTGRSTLICLHGGPGLNHKSLLPGLFNLYEIFDLIFVDLRGDGESFNPPNHQYGLADYAQDILVVAKEFKAQEPLGLFGHSFGGHVALQTLAEGKSVFDFGIISNTFVKFSDWAAFVSQSASELKNPTADEIEALYAASIKSDEDFKNLMLAYAPLYFPELSAVAARDLMSDWTYRAKTYNHAAENIYAGIDMTEACRKIQARCLAIGSENDKISNPAETEKIRVLIPQSSSALIKEAGHFPFLTRAAEFERSVLEWWRRL